LSVKGTGTIKENASGNSAKGLSRKSVVKLFKGEVKDL